MAIELQGTWADSCAGRCVACGGTYPGRQLCSSANDGSGEHVCHWCVGGHLVVFFEWLARLCPFCTLMVEPEHYNFIGNEFFGEPSTIGGIPSCAACEIVADMDDNAEQLLQELKGRSNDQ